MGSDGEGDGEPEPEKEHEGVPDLQLIQTMTVFEPGE